jgi:hypothetical protein
MAEKDINPQDKPKRGEKFSKAQELKREVYNTVKEVLEDTTIKAFKDKGFEHQKGYAGEYGDGKVYGTGVGEENGKFNVKVGSKTNNYFEKQISLGGKRAVSEIDMDVDTENEVLNMTYETRSSGLFRGHRDVEGGFMIEDEYIFNLKNMSKFKSDLKKKLQVNAEKEAGYITKTKLGVQDKVETAGDGSMVESTMEKFNFKDLFNASFDEFDEKMDSIINEGKKKKKKKDDVEMNHPEVIDANSPNNLLFDFQSLEEAKEKHGEKYAAYFEKMMNKYGAKSPDELKPSEWKTINQGWESMEEKGIEEVATSGGGAGAGTAGKFGYDAPGAFALGGDFDADMKKSNKKVNEAFENTPYAKAQKPRAQAKRLYQESDGFWTKVDIIDGSGYVPKGMDKNWTMGMHDVEVNSKEEEDRTAGNYKQFSSGRKKEAKNESASSSLGKRKFISESEQKELGVNKRYIITHKPTLEEQADRWRRLSSFEKYETIREAEEIISDEETRRIMIECGMAPVETEKVVSREQGEAENMEDFLSRNDDIEAGEEVDGKAVIIVPKPNSLSNVRYKVFKDDYLNENKAYILDMQTGTLVNNPNYKAK